jgi:hypothetical protein
VPKSSGLGNNLYLAGRDLSGDIGAITRIGGGPALLDVTGIDKSAFERIGGIRDGGVDFNAWYNADAGQSHTVLKALPTTDVQAMVLLDGTRAIGEASGCLVAKQVNYDPGRAQDGSLASTVNLQGSDGSGLLFGEMLTVGKRTDTAPTNGASLDYGAVSTAFGLTAYLQVFSLTGTNVVVTLEDSANDSTWAAITGAAFTSVTVAPGSQRIQTATGATIRRYVRAVTSGTFSNAVFAVSFTRHLTSTI